MYRLPQTWATALVAGLLTAFTPTMAPVTGVAVAEAPARRLPTITPPVIRAVMDNYYQAPVPEFVPAIVEAAIAQGLTEDRGSRLTLIAFMAGLISADVDVVDRLRPVFDKRTPEQAMQLVRAILYSGRSDWQALVARLRKAWPDKAAEIDAVAARGARPVYSLGFTGQPEVLAMNWAFFGATGNAEPVRAIIGALGDLTHTADPDRVRLAHRARISLARRAAEHDRVMEICRQSTWGAHGEDMRAIIRAALYDDIARLEADAEAAMRKLPPLPASRQGVAAGQGSTSPAARP